MTDDLLSQWGRWQRAQGHSENTINARTARVRSIAETSNVAPEDMTQDHVVNYLAALKTRSTKATYYSHLRAWFRWLIVIDYRDDDPTLKVPAPKAPRRSPRPITDKEMVLLIASRMHARTRMMILLASLQGLRVHEIAKFRGEDIDWTSKRLRVLGKGEVDATLPLSVEVALLAASFPRRGYWFVALDTPNRKRPAEHINSRSVSDVVGDAMKRQGITGGPHRLRHWYGTRLVKAGSNLRVVQEMLRHASLQTTQIYTKVDEDQMRAAMDGLSLPSATDAA